MRRLTITVFGWTALDVAIGEDPPPAPTPAASAEVGPVTERRANPVLGFASSRPRDLHRRPDIR